MKASSAASVHARRLTAQLLSGARGRDALAVAERLLSIQAQDPRGARLAVRARADRVTAADIDHALTDERSLLITWLNRGALHLIRSEDYGWLHALLTPPLHTSSLTRLSQNGIDAAGAERGVRVIARALSDEGPLTRLDLRERLRAAGLRTEGQALVHLLFRATLAGVSVRGPMVGLEHAYVLARDWLAPGARFDRDRALAELARRYLAGHGPASPHDLARWAGLPLRDTRAGLAAIGSELRALDGPGGLFELASRGRPARLPAPRLLGAFEPALMGWTSRAAVLGERDADVVLGGVFRAFAMVDGRGVGIWKLVHGRVQVTPLQALDASVMAALELDGEAVRAFLGLD